MENVLIISSNKNAAETLSEFIRESFQCSVKAVETAYQARIYLDKNKMTELAVINSPLMDESGEELAEYIIQNSVAGCILLGKSERIEKISEKAEKCGIILISKPFNRTLLYQLIKTVDISVRRSWKLYEETIRLEQKIDEIKTVDKAKFLLMEYRGMTEEKAHNYLEQYAMNKRKKKSIAALEIIDKINEQYL